MRTSDHPVLSIIVIGLNEEKRLKSSLESVFLHTPSWIEAEVFYVDSGSSDRSLEIASQFARLEILELRTSQPSASKARNVGLRHARGEFVQLVDGDSSLQPGWIEAGLLELRRARNVACTFGQCIEMYPEQSIYMKVCGLDWHVPPGDHSLCGGNSMWRMSFIAAQGFFDETLRFGEEPDLCYRVRHQGGRIVCLGVPMVKHDLGIVHFHQYWRRAENSGKAYMHIASRYWRRSEKLWFREVLRNFAEPIIWVLIFLLGWKLSNLSGGIALLFAWIGGRALQIGYTVSKRTMSFADALLYGLHSQFMCIPLALGQLKAARYKDLKSTDKNLYTSD